MSATRYDRHDDYYWERRWRDRMDDRPDGWMRRSRGFPWGVFFVGALLGAIIF